MLRKLYIASQKEAVLQKLFLDKIQKTRRKPASNLAMSI